MEIKEFEDLRQRIEAAKSTKARAEGAYEQILAKLKKDFGVETVADIEAEIEKLEEEIDGDEDKLDGICAEIDGITDWSKI